MAYDGLSMMIFGGHRLWHGFATDNSESNSWSSYAEYPKGGYLDDLWVYTKRQLAEDELVRMRDASSTALGWGGVVSAFAAGFRVSCRMYPMYPKLV